MGVHRGQGTLKREGQHQMLSVRRTVIDVLMCLLAVLTVLHPLRDAGADSLSSDLYDGERCLRPVRVGYLPGRPPYQMVSEAGEAGGVDLEVARGLLQAIGCQAEFVAVGWPRALPLLERGMIDMLPGASYSPERADYALFSAPYRRERYALYVRSGQTGAFPLTSLADVGVQRFHLALNADALYGPEVAALLADPLFRAQVTLIKGVEQPLLVTIGRVDGYLLDTGTASSYNGSVSRAEQLERHPAVTIDNGPVHFMFSRLTVPDQLAVLISQRIALSPDAADAGQ